MSNLFQMALLDSCLNSLFVYIYLYDIINYGTMICMILWYYDMYDIINYCTIIIFMVFNFAYIPSQLNNLIVLAYRHVYIIAHFFCIDLYDIIKLYIYIISHTKLVYSLAYLLDQYHNVYTCIIYNWCVSKWHIINDA